MVAGSLTYDTKVDTKGFSSGISSVSKIAKAGFTAVATSLTAVSVGIAKVVKDSVTARGELEQQIGGIETLFKDNAETVIKYANEAYKTAGLSAVNYMQTATSFSASLLQSLDDDTQKTAEYTNRAIIDMSDNANKMGTSMEMIQNAYQGFAKQNYTINLMSA